ncbi:hypothetical protein, partial [Streptomyces sp. NPDC048639]|uniref:hypothetical protein n=1 Tax=Streptomyces sp. NPDC048639 TaxID=3365581 RepID=UPI003723E0D7
HHESGTTGGIIRQFTASSLCVFFKGTTPRTKWSEDGVSTYLALTFGTLLSSQGTDASFKTIPGFSGRFPSVSPTLSDFSGSDFHPPEK